MLQEYVNAKASSCISLVKFWSTQLFSKISSCGISQVYRWSKLPIKNFNKIVIPVNLGNSHWVLCTIWIAEKKIEYYDSFVKLQNFSHKVFTLLFDWLGGEYMKLDEIVRAEDWTFFMLVFY
jgi:sentrin-specific protease 1